VHCLNIFNSISKLESRKEWLYTALEAFKGKTLAKALLIASWLATYALGPFYAYKWMLRSFFPKYLCTYFFCVHTFRIVWWERMATYMFVSRKETLPEKMLTSERSKRNNIWIENADF
jgi:hypothetical protein